MDLVSPLMVYPTIPIIIFSFVCALSRFHAPLCAGCASKMNILRNTNHCVAKYFLSHSYFWKYTNLKITYAKKGFLWFYFGYTWWYVWKMFRSYLYLFFILLLLLSLLYYIIFTFSYMLNIIHYMSCII